MWRPVARDSAADGRAGDGGRADADGVARTAAAWEQLGANLEQMGLNSCAHRVRRIRQPPAVAGGRRDILTQRRGRDFIASFCCRFAVPFFGHNALFAAFFCRKGFYIYY